MFLSLLWDEGEKFSQICALFVNTVEDLVLTGSAWGETTAVGTMSAVHVVAVLGSAWNATGPLSVFVEVVGFVFGGLGFVFMGSVDVGGLHGGNLDRAPRERNVHRE